MREVKLPELKNWIPKYKKWTLLPELLDFLGEDGLRDFIQIFGGLTIVVPTQNRWNTWVRNLRIYKRLRQTRPYAVLSSLASHYEISTERVRHIYMEVREVLGR